MLKCLVLISFYFDTWLLGNSSYGFISEGYNIKEEYCMEKVTKDVGMSVYLGLLITVERKMIGIKQLQK